MYKCDECGGIFNEPKSFWSRDEKECPKCGCEDFEEAYECEECGEYFLKEELFDSEDITEDEYQATGDFDQMCRKCIDKLVKENE